MTEDVEGKRKFPRIRVNLEVEYSIEDDSFKEHLVNMSMGGVFIKTDNPVYVDTILDLKFSLPGLDRKIEITGKVMWASLYHPDDPTPPGMGILFTNTGKEDKRILEEYISKHLNDLEP